MNIAVTDGITLMPPSFGDGLDVWSSEDGTPGTQTYNGASNASLIAADADFGVCLEMTKTQSVQQLRYMGETPIPTGTYLEIKVRIKAISGTLPSVRIAGWAGAAGGTQVTGVAETGSTTVLDTYGKVIEVSAIVGGGSRTGVDMPWGSQAIYGHFGLDLTGATGGVVRIEDFSITDVTSVYLRDLIDVVDVMDYGAIPDGISDCVSAFEAADADANGRDILVPEGLYYLANSVTFSNPVRFQGTVTMPTEAMLFLTRNYDFPSYADAFGDEELALKKALQALMFFTDHDTLDLQGRRIEISEPLDVQAAVYNRDTYSTRKVVRNGQINAENSSSWDDVVITSTATYSNANSRRLFNVANVAQIEVGSLVTGTGVGREVYVSDVDVDAGEVGLCEPLHGASPSQTYTFTKFQYMLDFSGFSRLQRFELDGIDFFCNGRASAVAMPMAGLDFRFRDCTFTKPKDRGISSFADGCAGMKIDRCTFYSNEQDEEVENRKTIGFNVNSNDIKVRDNRAVRFLHFGVLSGTGFMISNNHFFQGDSSTSGTRSAGLIFTRTNLKSTIIGNYVDNCFIEINNEHDIVPEYNGTNSFGGFTITGNFFTASDPANWFSWIQIAPYGAGHYLNGLSISDNVFKIASGNAIERAERVNTTYADLDHSKAYNVNMTGNSYIKVTNEVANPLRVEFVQSSNSTVWSQNLAGRLPFGGHIHHVEAFAPLGRLENNSGTLRSSLPYFDRTGDTQLNVRWPSTTRGTVYCSVRSDAIS